MPGYRDKNQLFWLDEAVSHFAPRRLKDELDRVRSRPAASRYAATTPGLLGWFSTYNQKRDYGDQVRPSNFLLAYQIMPTRLYRYPSVMRGVLENHFPKPIAEYSKDITQAAKKCFDRQTGERIPSGTLKSYKEALAQYHLRPEHKFLNGNYTEKGITRRRHIKVVAVRQIGKESNRWEEQFYLGVNEGEKIDYGVSQKDAEIFLGSLRAEIKAAGQRTIARESGISRRTLSRLMRGSRVRKQIVSKIVDALRARNTP